MRGRVGAGFAALCLLLGTEWIAEFVAPRVLPGLWGAGARLAALAGLFGAAGLRGKGAWGGWRLAAWGAVLLGLLPVMTAGARGSVTGLTGLLVGALVPAAVVFAAAQGEESGGEDGFRLLLPALAAFAGMALLISYAIPSSTRGLLWLVGLAVSAVATGFAMVRVHGLLRGAGAARGAAVIAGGGAIALMACCWVGGVAAPAFDARGAMLAAGRLLGMDVPVMLLTVWLLREMRPVAYSARYVLGLFVAVAESFAVARPGWDWTKLLAVALVGGGGWWLLRADGLSASQSAIE